MSKRKKILVGVLAAIVLGVTVGPFVYIHFIQTKAPAAFASCASADPFAGTAAQAGTFSADGTWSPTAASAAGYRIKEVLFGQSTVAAGRTTKVTGSMTIAGNSVSKASFTVDMASVASDQSQRDDQFRGRIMETSKYPTATFELTSPLALSSIPADRTPMTTKATGNLTLHGTTKATTLDLCAQRNGDSIDVTGSIPIVFADWGVPNPSGGPASTEDHGVIEFLLVFAKAA